MFSHFYHWWNLNFVNHGKKDPSVNFHDNSYVISREQSESYPLVQEKQGRIAYVTSTWLPSLIIFPSDFIPKFFLVHVLSGMLNFNVGIIKTKTCRENIPWKVKLIIKHSKINFLYGYS